MAEVSGGTAQSVGAVRVGSQVSVLVDGWILSVARWRWRLTGRLVRAWGPHGQVPAEAVHAARVQGRGERTSFWSGPARPLGVPGSVSRTRLLHPMVDKKWRPKRSAGWDLIRRKWLEVSHSAESICRESRRLGVWF